MRTSPIINQRLAQLQFQDRVQEAEHARRGAQLPRLSHRSGAREILRAAAVGSWWPHRWHSILTRRKAGQLTVSALSAGD